MSGPYLVCRICGDTARGRNFNVLTCMSCKTFFRRNAHRRSSMLKCQLHNDCSITKLTRSYCASCRLEKCFAYGMDPLVIRSVLKGSNKTKNTERKQIQPSMIPTLDLLRNDRSTLTSEQWNVISNTIHMYDKEQLLVKIKHSIEEMNSLPIKLRSKLSLTSDLINKAMAGISTLMEHFSQLQSLTHDTRRTLSKHNIHTTSTLNALFIYREMDLSNNPVVTNASSVLYSSEILKLFARNSRQCDPNGLLIKIFLFVLIFSSNCSIVAYDNQEDLRTMSNVINLIEIQNIYITAFWKYLVYLSGYEQAVLRFSSMIQQVLNILSMGELALNINNHKQMIDALITQTERCLNIS